MNQGHRLLNAGLLGQTAAEQVAHQWREVELLCLGIELPITGAAGFQGARVIGRTQAGKPSITVV